MTGPSVRSVRVSASEMLAAPLIVSGIAGPRTVVPLPAIWPPVHSSEPVTVTVPLPSSVPFSITSVGSVASVSRVREPSTASRRVVATSYVSDTLSRPVKMVTAVPVTLR
ncbi:MAG: hypothetical protein AAF594_06825 [Bacteroidota bacterium]